MTTVGVILEYRKSTFNIIIFSLHPRQCGTMDYKPTFSVDGPGSTLGLAVFTLLYIFSFVLFPFVLLIRLFVCLLIILFPFG